MAQNPAPPGLGSPGALPGRELDPANVSLADALRKSFRVLKALMLVLVVLYFLSGWFSVKQGERGVVFRFGNIVGKDTPDAVKEPGWHWSWPFPIDQWQTVAVNQRELPVEFMFQLTEKERATKIIQRKFAPLAPERDDYLVTGDVNILHVSLKIKYNISNVIDYVSNVHPMPAPNAGVRSHAYLHYPEYTILRNLSRDAIIETAARQAALDIRGSRQDAFLLEVGRRLRRKLDILARRGTPLGIHIDPANGVIAPKWEGGTLEAIMPPRQTQEVFDKVFAAQNNKTVAIMKARADAEALLVNTAGPDYQRLANAIEKEYELLRAVSLAESKPGQGANGPDLKTLRDELEHQREETEHLLKVATGSVQSIIKDAEIRKNNIVKEARGDYERYLAVLPEYLLNPSIFRSRLLDEARARALADDAVTKVFVPPGAKQYRLHIPRSNTVPEEGEKKEKGKTGAADTSGSFRPAAPTLELPSDVKR